ncbi:MAG TPA: hypothetical protein VGB77_19930 [Abditibacteriaceae bacterium]
MPNNQKFHITIGAGAAANESVSQALGHEMQLIKTALLYADEATLCTATAAHANALFSAPNLSTSEKIKLLKILFPLLDQNDKTPWNSWMDIYQQITTSKNLPPNLLVQRNSIQKRVNEAWQLILNVGDDTYGKSNIEKYSRLLRQGKLKIKLLESSPNTIDMIAEIFRGAIEKDSDAKLLRRSSQGMQAAEEYLAELQKTLNDPATYPLFDDHSGALINTSIQLGKVKLSQMQMNRTKHIGLAADLLQRLPLFDNASIDEILDIQKELKKPLIKFRAALIQYSQEMNSASWTEDFPLEADSLFRSKIEPVIQEIEDSTKSNKFLIALQEGVTERPALPSTTSLFGMALTQFQNLPGFVLPAVSGLAVGTGLVFADAHKRYRQKSRDIESNQLFFYYKARVRLRM